MRYGARDRELTKSEYTNRLVIDSTEFNNVAYEVKEGAVLVKVWSIYRGLQQFEARFEELERLALEFLELCDGWQNVRT